jgi:hypothetical protein
MDAIAGAWVFAGADGVGGGGFMEGLAWNAGSVGEYLFSTDF